MALRRESSTLNDVLTEAVQAMRPLAEERQQHIAMRMAASLHVTGDDVRLRQVFSNWLLNATKYTPSGGEIEIDGIRDGERVIVTVTDTGRGIRPELLPPIFDLFVRDNDSHGGMGIGLHVVRRLVEAHGGSVEARSAGVDRGSQFIVALPAAS